MKRGRLRKSRRPPGGEDRRNAAAGKLQEAAAVE
jgi:hypothetical protein